MTPEQLQDLRNRVPQVIEGHCPSLCRELLIHIEYLRQDNERLKEEVINLKARLEG